MDDEDPDYRAREDARRSYRPDRIEWLLIAEAPPASLDRFFYYGDVNEKDFLFIETMKVLHPDRPDQEFRPPLKGEYLHRFMEDGFYLIDVFDSPIDNDMRSRKKKEKVLASRHAVLRKLKELEPFMTEDTKIILIKATVYELADALRDAGYYVANT